MTREEARQIIASWLASSKGGKGQCGYIEGWFYEKDVEAFRMAIEALSAERTGEWIEHDPKTKGLAKIYECPFCGDEVIGEKTNYCPNCGAKMKGGTENDGQRHTGSHR